MSTFCEPYCSLYQYTKRIVAKSTCRLYYVKGNYLFVSLSSFDCLSLCLSLYLCFPFLLLIYWSSSAHNISSLPRIFSCPVLFLPFALPIVSPAFIFCFLMGGGSKGFLGKRLAPATSGVVGVLLK